MKARSRGLCHVGTWYTMSTTLEYINRRVRMPRRTVEIRNASNTWEYLLNYNTAQRDMYLPMQ
jgi:hypothetical protein